jgi:hypothetical protein
MTENLKKFAKFFWELYKAPVAEAFAPMELTSGICGISVEHKQPRLQSNNNLLSPRQAGTASESKVTPPRNAPLRGDDRRCCL